MLPELVLPPGPFAAYLFDLDGTVADTMPLHYSAWREALLPTGVDFPEELFYAWGGVPPRAIVERLNLSFNATLNPDAIVQRKEALYLDLLAGVQPVAAVLAHIDAAAGSLPFAIVSGSPRDSIERTLATLGLEHHFPLLVGSEDYTQGKPHPEPFLTAARLLGVDPARCLVFEDADAGIESATRAGMSWVRVPRPPRPI